MRTYYRDKSYEVTQTAISTPRRIYPLGNSQARIRRDPLWFALAFSVFCIAAHRTYGDLLHDHEIVAMIFSMTFALLIGWQFSILQLHAIGHERAVIFASTRRVKRLFAAIRQARGDRRAAGQLDPIQALIEQTETSS
jgi:hypothetical protein